MANTTGKKFGGRKPGSMNKRTKEIQDKLEELGCDPIEGLARIGMTAERDAQGVLEHALEAAIARALEQDEQLNPEFLESVVKNLDGDVKIRLQHLHLAATCYSQLRKHWAPELKSIEISAGDLEGLEHLEGSIVERMAASVLAKQQVGKPPKEKTTAKKAPAKKPAGSK